MNLLRAAGLLVDTGLHVFGWSRQKSIEFLLDNTATIEFLLDNTAMSYPICEHEVDRYLAVPCIFKIQLILASFVLLSCTIIRYKLQQFLGLFNFLQT